jgi:hypothetical protein
LKCEIALTILAEIILELSQNLFSRSLSVAALEACWIGMVSIPRPELNAAGEYMSERKLPMQQLSAVSPLSEESRWSVSSLQAIDLSSLIRRPFTPNSLLQFFSAFDCQDVETSLSNVVNFGLFQSRCKGMVLFELLLSLFPFGSIWLRVFESCRLSPFDRRKPFKTQEQLLTFKLGQCVPRRCLPAEAKSCHSRVPLRKFAQDCMSPDSNIPRPNFTTKPVPRSITNIT